MGICIVCEDSTKDTIWMDMCEDCLSDYESTLYDKPDQNNNSITLSLEPTIAPDLFRDVPQIQSFFMQLVHQNPQLRREFSYNVGDQFKITIEKL